MSLLCNCPAAAALTTIPAMTCPENFGQIQKVAFTRLHSSAGVKNSFTSSNSILLLASWTALMAAAADTKIVVSPYIQAPTADGGDAITFGGGNDTLGGVTTVVGKNPINFSSVMRQVPQSIVATMKDLMCEAAADNLGVYLFNEHGQIGALQDATTATTYYPIPIRSLFVGDKVFGGLETPDSNALNWSFLPNWSDQFKIVSPTDFNPLTDLVPASN